jgi:hypothetical protein
MPDELAPSVPTASFSFVELSNAIVMSLLTQMNDQFISMDDRFLTMDQGMQLIEADVAQININVRNTLRNILPDDQRDQVP